jgi:hypothetical protein
LSAHRWAVLDFVGKVLKNKRKAFGNTRAGAIQLEARGGNFTIKTEIEYLNADDLFNLRDGEEVEIQFKIVTDPQH